MCHQERACSPNSVTYLNKSINRCDVLMCHQNNALPTDAWSDKCEAVPMCWKDLLAIIIKKNQKALHQQGEKILKKDGVYWGVGGYLSQSVQN